MEKTKNVVCVDTNVFFNVLKEETPFLAGSKKLLDAIHAGKLQGIISVISVSEILTGFYAKGEEARADKFLVDLLSLKNFIITDVSLTIGKDAAKIKGQNNKFCLADAIILATARLNNASLATRDDIILKEENATTPEKVLENI